MTDACLSEWQLVNNALADACVVAGSQQAWARENGSLTPLGEAVRALVKPEPPRDA